MRFSYLGKSDARLSRLVEGQEKFDLLYHPDRMAQRFYVFENITLPSLKNQTFKNWRIDILISEAMPEVYKARLKDLVANVPQIGILESNIENVTNAFDALIKDRVTVATERTIHFRTDDDDALAVNALAVLEAHREHAPKHGLITMPNGLYLHSDGVTVSLMRKFEHNIAIGWALVNNPGQFRNPYHYVHGGLWYRTRSLVLADFPAYIHCAYESCDTQPAHRKKLNQAKSWDPDYDTEDGKTDLRHALRRHFPWTSYEELKDTFEKIPDGHKTAVWTNP